MADQTFEQKLLFSAESKLGDVQNELLALNETLTEQLTKQKLLALQGKQNTAAYQQISSAVRLTKEAIRQTAKEYDNTSKAINANNGSITQNRALVSSMTAEFIKLGQTEGATAKSTVEMGERINVLNQRLKEQEKQMGMTNRNVGNYKNDIESALSSLTGSIPGFQQFAGITQATTKIIGFLPSAFKSAGNSITNFIGNPGRNVISGFGKMKQSAGEAATEIESIAPAAAEAGEGAEGASAGMGELAASGGAVTLIIGAVVGALAGAWQYLKDVAGVSDTVSNKWAGMKAQMVSLANTLRSDGLFGGHFMENMNKAYIDAQQLNQAMIDLNRTMVASDVKTNEENQFIATQMLKMRNIHTTAAEAEKIFTEIANTSKTQFDRVSKNAEAGYNILAHKIALSAGLNKQELTVLAREGVAAAEEFKKEGKHISDDLITEYAKFQDMRTNAQAIKDQQTQRAENKEEQRIAKIEAQSQKTQSEIDEANRAAEQIDEERKNSAIRVLELSMDGYAKELSATDRHFKELLFKNKEFIEKSQSLQKKAKTPQAKAAYQADIDKAKAAAVQFHTEWSETIDKVVRDNTDKMVDQIIAADLEVKQIINQGEKDQVKQKIESEKLKLQATLNTLDNEKKAYDDDQVELKGLMQNASGARLTELQKEYDHNVVMLQNLALKRKTIEKNTDDAILDIIQDSVQKQIKARDEAAIISTGENGANQNHDAHYDALQKQLDDDHKANLQKLIEGKITQDEFAKMDEQYMADSTALKKKAVSDRKEFEIRAAEEVANAAYSILQNSIQHSAQATLAGIERQKTFELNNQALTNTQKQIINEKYRVQEGKAKVREFHQEQALSVAKIAIQTAINVVKDASKPWQIALDIAMGALEEGVVLSQKAPAYATGGLHYNSDGRGSLLRGPGTGTSDSMNARLSNGEAVINERSTKMFSPLLSAINQIGGGRPFDGLAITKPTFAGGGVFNTYLPTGDGGLRPTLSISSRLHADDLSSLAAQIGAHFNNAVTNMPPPIVDVKDVAFAQEKLAVVRDMSTH